MKNKYNLTVKACYTGYVTQAIVNNIAPLLFVTFGSTYDISLEKITTLATFNFLVQLITDVLSAKFIHKIGYKAGVIIAHITATIGLAGLGFFPDIFEKICGDGYIGLLVAIFFYAIGGGLIEVLVSPLINGGELEKKCMAMNLLHSFYCWGQVAVILLSTVFFAVAGIENWRVLVCLWAIVPFVNTIVFIMAPIPVIPGDENPVPIRKLFSKKVFWILIVLMLCAGASEHAMSQWSSTFAEKGLNVPKAFGDLLGPCMFAVLMGVARIVTAMFEEKIKTETMMMASAVLCFVSYIVAALVPIPIISLLGCAMCGFSVGIFWPGTFNIAERRYPLGGTKLFALLALSGDLGCGSGPTLVGMVTGAFGENFKIGLLAASMIPVVMIVFLLLGNSKFFQDEKSV